MAEGVPSRSVAAPSRSWVFTLNNYTNGDEQWILNITEQCPRIVVTKEVGADGTPHLQGYVTFGQAMRLAALKKMNARAHWEKAKAEECAALYPLKEDSIILVNKNNVITPGGRSDLKKAYAAIKGKRSFRDFLIDDEPGYQAIQVYKVASLVMEPARSMEAAPEVIWRYGPTGVGKTRWAWETYPDLYNVPSFKWWDGYHGQETVLIDDFRADFCKFHELLVLLDRYPLRKETKGGWVQCHFKRVIITSPLPPSQAYHERSGEQLAQLMRRITQTIYCMPDPDVVDLTTDVIDLFD